MAAPASSSFNNGPDGKSLVLQAADIVQLIGQTVALKKAGRRYSGLCPFHSEKSPSFSVNPDEGFFYCFGCKASGNAIDFVMKRDHLEFREALHALADQYNVELPRGGSSREGAGLRQSLLDCCSAAASFFEQNLAGPAGASARAYLAKRGFTDETIKRFRIGLATDGWDNLARSPLMKKFRPDLLLQAGLLKAKVDENTGEVTRMYDTFRERIMFPIRDEAGRVIAFGGRITPEADKVAKAAGRHVAKYLNSPETPLFSKSKVAYGLDLGRPKVVETKTVAVVEGYTDVVMAHQYGASNVISVLGTALTEQHVNLLRRFASRIVLLFDGDSAGDMAVQRAIELFLTQPIEIGIATLPDGVDPDEYLLQHGQAGFDKLLAGAEDALTFQWRQMSKRYRASDNDLTAQSKTIEEYLGQIAAARGTGPVDPIRWGATIVRLSHLTRLSTAELNGRFPAARDLSPLPAAPPAWGQRPPFGQKKQFGDKKPFNGQKTFGDKKPFPGKPSFGNKNASGPYKPYEGNRHNYNSQRDSRPSHFDGEVGYSAPDDEPDGGNFVETEKNSLPNDTRRGSGRRRAERWILGGLLHYPSAWQEIQQSLAAEEFRSEELRPLAVWYWDYQRNEGEPTLSEVIALLDSGPLKSLAIELASEADAMNNRQTLVDAVNFVRQEKARQADTKLLGELRRSNSGQRGDDSSEVDALKLFQNAAGKRSAPRA